MTTEERLELLKTAEPNSWIALSSDESKVVGRGSSYAEAVNSDVAAVSAMLDRLLHHGHVLKCGPRSWRTKTAVAS